MNFPPILLASGSPRRRFLLQDAGFDVQFTNPDIDESFPPTLPANEIPLFLAKEKNLAVDSELLIVSADTIVCIKDEILNKPANDKEAFEMLNKLSGKAHSVYTGVYMRHKHQQQGFVEESKVFFKDLNPDFIKTYIQQCKPFDKAGSYGIQDMMGYFGIFRIEGCYYNVMGFPLARFYDELKVFLQK
ncbi:MAG: Maf family nucleotide pyrophosphatase [Bacteroidia bacterium]|nr:septum formation protein Maf [Bacteroidia bacterium]MCO5254937.1 Maf family nucleotide pyrophosphatase [Bacteroidota bacterium]MCZ2131301.1 Maf family nucleotide pyrophosphatase [Bacteroidia bacterium]